MVSQSWSRPPIFSSDQRSRATRHLVDYFIEDDYTGASFETLGQDGDRPEVANTATADDLAALALLSVPVGGFAARDLLTSPLAEEIGALLSEIPPDASIESEAGRALLRDEDGPAVQLWTTIRRAGRRAPARMRKAQSFGAVRTSKLLARKRPHLFPIYDAVVASEFTAESSRGQWQFYCTLFEDDMFVEHIRSIRTEVGLERISLLRIIDVIAWMEGNSTSR